ncbi:bone morphogenetic protein 1 homolog isoform X2 [Ptychodera flava]|uniref:bone morphogenetic protein 1 homolog isoform X2 n=1 Tax=Ptychodera flava TaxID=63121 RepID=UPI00396A458E
MNYTTAVWLCLQVALLVIGSQTPATARGHGARGREKGLKSPRIHRKNHQNNAYRSQHHNRAQLADDSTEMVNVIDPCPAEDIFQRDILLDYSTLESVADLYREERHLRRRSLGYTYKKQDNHTPDLRRHRRAATSIQTRLWPGGIIPYTISNEHSNSTRQNIFDAIAHWEEHTCIKFVTRTDQKDYVHFHRGNSCCSYVGRLGVGKQLLSIGPACDSFGIILHEIGHAVGFWHEQSRPDRDDFVEVISENMRSGARYNYNKLSKSEVNSMDQPYDYDSIMHYGTHYYSKNRLWTLKPKVQNARIGQRKKLSDLDIIQTNLLYRCHRKAECGGTLFQAEGYIMSPNYPYKYPGNNTCHWVISVRESFTVTAEFQHFDLPDKVNGECVDYVELRNGRGELSPLIGRYCGNIPPNRIIADGDSLWVKFHTGDGRFHDKTGFFIDFKSGACRQVLTDKRGSIQSLGYPLPFPANMDCVWQISVPHGFIVTLAIRDLYIAESGPGCSRNYLSIIDGDDDTSEMITKICQPQSNVGVATSGSHLRLRLHSGLRPNNTIGELPMRFDATYVARDIDECSVNQGGCEQACLNLIGTYACGCRWGYRVAENNKNCTDINECETNNGGCSHTCKNLIGAYVCECPTGFYLAHNQKECIEIQRCGGYFTEAEGTMKSPVLSKNNHNNNTIDCVWSIAVGEDSSVAISLHIDDWPKNNEDCVDYISVRQGHGPEGRSYRICDPSDWPGDYNTHSQVVWISYHSEWPHGGAFTIYYRAERRANVGSHCGGVFNGTTGTLESPGFPNNYPNKVDCVWKITGKTIKLEFDVFDLENQENCRFDFLDISDGSDNSIGRFCGVNTPPQILTSSTGELWITFQSDASVQGQGFRAFIEVEL